MFNFKSEAEKVAKEVAQAGLHGVEVALPTAAEVLIPGAGGTLAASILNGVFSHVSQGGTKPNVGLLQTSIGQLVEGFFGILEATGRVQPSNPVIQVVEKVIGTQPGVVVPQVSIPQIQKA